MRCSGVGVLRAYSVLTTVECARLLNTYPSVVKVNAISKSIPWPLTRPVELVVVGRPLRDSVEEDEDNVARHSDSSSARRVISTSSAELLSVFPMAVPLSPCERADR